MHYTQFFRQLREEKKLGQEELAAQAGCHRNTVINVESDRPVKFSTIADLMRTLGYGPDSKELRQIALLWLEAVSGVRFTPEEASSTARKIRTEYRSAVAPEMKALSGAITRRGLKREQIRLLHMAAEHPEILEMLEALSELLARPDAPAAGEHSPDLMVAED